MSLKAIRDLAVIGLIVGGGYLIYKWIKEGGFKLPFTTPPFESYAGYPKEPATVPSEAFLGFWGARPGEIQVTTIAPSGSVETQNIPEQQIMHLDPEQALNPAFIPSVVADPSISHVEVEGFIIPKWDLIWKAPQIIKTGIEELNPLSLFRKIWGI